MPIDITHGGGDSSVVRSAGLVIERSRVRIPAGAAGEFSSPGSTFCADFYFGIRFTPVLPAVARKKSRSFCQKRRWQVTPKHAYNLRNVALHEVAMVHGCMVYTEPCAETAAVSCGTSHASAVKYTTSVGYIKIKNKNAL